jgi:polyisoprenoid-binding protein YceI
MDIGTSAPEAPLHVRGGGSLGGIVVTPDVTDTQSQILLAENTTASNAMLMRYNGTTNNLEFRGRAADVESAAHVTINRDSGAVVIDPATATGDGSVQLPIGSISATETLNEAGVASVSNTTAVTLPVQVTSTVDSVTINAPTSGKVVVFATVQFSNPDSRDQAIRSVISTSSVASATTGYRINLRGFDVLAGDAFPETFTMHKVFTVVPGSNTFYLRSRPVNDAPLSFAPPTADDIALTATFFPTTY